MKRSKIKIKTLDFFYPSEFFSSPKSEKRPLYIPLSKLLFCLKKPEISKITPKRIRKSGNQHSLELIRDRWKARIDLQSIHGPHLSEIDPQQSKKMRLYFWKIRSVRSSLYVATWKKKTRGITWGPGLTWNAGLFIISGDLRWLAAAEAW